MIFRNFTNDELLSRALSNESSDLNAEILVRFEKLIDEQVNLPDADFINVTVSEAISQYPEEDFIDDIKNRVANLAKKVRGVNKEEVLSILTEIEDLATVTMQSTEYGCEQLKELEIRNIHSD